MKQIGQFVLFAFIAIVFASFATTSVAAQNPHYVSSSASVQADGTLLVTWKEAGLGNGQVIDYDAEANATAVYGCVNPGQHHPKASNKETVSGPVSATGSFTAGKNGAINGSLILTPPPMTTNFTCPPGQTLVLGSITYNGVGVEDNNNNLYDELGGPYSRVFYPW